MARFAAGDRRKGRDSAKPVQSPEDNVGAEAIELLQDQLHSQAWDLEIQCRFMQDALGELEESRNRYAALYDFSPVGYVTLDDKGCIREINLTGAALLGMERSQLIGLPMSVFIEKDFCRLFFIHLRASRLGGEKVIAEFKLSSTKAKVIYAQFVTTPVPGIGGHGLQYRTVIVDITELKNKETEIAGLQAAEKALMESQTQLVASQERLKHYSIKLAATNSELRSFANIIAHDFRSPMVNLKGFAKELACSLDDLKHIMHKAALQLPEDSRKKAEDLLEKDVPESLGFIDSSVDRLNRIVDGLLQLVRLGRREMIYKSVDMEELVGAVSHSFHHQIQEPGIQLEVEPLPHIETDYLAVEQIIGNLLDNAIKYLKPGQPGKIVLACTDEGDEYLFSVQDNGRGIIAADLEKVFDIFSRSGTQDVPGEGMGLAYIRTLVRQLGGKVWCESEPGVGTKMFFTIHKGPVRD